jgi:hypothetical protein
MCNETFFVGENKTALLLLRFAQPEHSSPSHDPGFPTTTIFYLVQLLLLWLVDLHEAAGTLRHPPHSPSNQPRRFPAATGKVVRSCFPRPFFQVLKYFFRKTHLANSLPVTANAVNVGQTARRPRLGAFGKIEPKESGCRLLLSRI